MRILFAFGAVAALAFGLSGCAVIDVGTTVVGAGASVGVTALGTAADVAGDVISAPFGSSSDSGDDGHKK